MLFTCHSDAVYSHCQVFYVVIYDSEKNLCSSFRREPCSILYYFSNLDIDKDFDDVTLITILTLNRKDRLPYLMKRWKHRINMAIFLQERDIPEVKQLINEYSSFHRIKFILYIVKDKIDTPYRSIYFDPVKPIYSNETIFPINVLRDLAIESIETTHYYVSDIDVFASDTLYDTILLHKNLLRNPKSVFILKSFLMSEEKVNHTDCYKTGNCSWM